jgi:hypothetical protein
MLLVVLAVGAFLALPCSGAGASEYQQISKQFEREHQEFFKAQDSAKTAEERDKVKFPDREKYALQMVALAEKNPKDPVAIDALLWAIENGRHDSPARLKALDALKGYDFDSEKLEQVCRVLAEEEDKAAADFLTDIIARSPRQNTKGAAALALGQLLAAENPKEAEKHFTDVIEKYGTKEQKETAKAELFEMQNLVIGKVAPEIEGEDVDGKKFKLSDYRGKVVVIDFWGDW